jgi:hypothetical protein
LQPRLHGQLRRPDLEARVEIRLGQALPPAGLVRPGENVWSPNDPLVTAFDTRSA